MDILDTMLIITTAPILALALLYFIYYVIDLIEEYKIKMSGLDYGGYHRMKEKKKREQSRR